jgi:hypothetical protein
MPSQKVCGAVEIRASVSVLGEEEEIAVVARIPVRHVVVGIGGFVEAGTWVERAEAAGLVGTAFLL